MARTPESLKYPTTLEIMEMLVLIGILLFAMVGCASAEERPMYRPNCYPLINHTCSELVEAIGHAENSKVHPYGIIPKYKHTTPQEACMNTVKHAVMDYVKAGEPGDFIDFLAGRYAPLNMANDPNGLNKYWVKNVKWFLVKGGR